MKLSVDIERVAKLHGIAVEIITAEQMEDIRNRVRENYCNKSRKSFLWECLADASVVCHADGWMWIADFIADHPCIMFFDEHEDRAGIAIDDGRNLYRLLAEMYGFECYVTNAALEYLLCLNHHDCLMGCGGAKEWVETVEAMHLKDGGSGRP